MATTPVEQQCMTVSMEVASWASNKVEQLSPVYRISGFPWRLRLYQGNFNQRGLALICEKSKEAELWQCAATINTAISPIVITHTFTSWDEASQERCIAWGSFPTGVKLQVEISTNDDGERWRLRPTVDSLGPRDGILVIGVDKKKIHVNKETLAAQSPFFDRLFNGDFKEKNMQEIPIGDVDYEELSNIIRMVYGFDGASLTDENVHQVLQLADRFELKIVEDRVVSYILSPSCSFSLHQKLLIPQEFNIPFLMDSLVSQYNGNAKMQELIKSPEYELLSMETLRTLFEKSCQLTR